MSVALASSAIKKFLTSDTPEVFCLKGKWGVGKTYTWDALLKENKKVIPLEQYSYVSLFGLNSLDDIRTAIVTNAEPVSTLGEVISWESAKDNPTSVGQRVAAKIMTWADVMPIDKVKQITEALQAASFLRLSKHLICIDDLERKGKGLAVTDIFGLASYLKEQRKCKVVLILNDGKLEEQEDQNEFDRLFEKVIDAHVTFAPTVSECTSLALPNNDFLHNILRPFCELLAIRNFRVIRQIERLGRMLETDLSSFEPEVLTRAVKIATILGWSKYGEDVPSLSFVKQRRSVYRSNNQSPSEDEKKWGALMDAYNFTFFTELDNIVLQGIENGYFDSGALAKQGENLQAELHATQSEAKFHEAWKLYHDSFKDNKAELVEALASSFRENAQHIHPMNVNGTVTLLKELGETELAKQLIQHYVEVTGDDFFDRSRLFSSNDVSDEDFAKAFDKRIKERVDDRDPWEVLKKVSNNRGWYPADITKLATVDADGFYEMFKRKEGDDLDAAIRFAIDIGKMAATDDAAKKITNNSVAALRKIAAENELNRRRVQKYGILSETES